MDPLCSVTYPQPAVTVPSLPRGVSDPDDITVYFDIVVFNSSMGEGWSPPPPKKRPRDVTCAINHSPIFFFQLISPCSPCAQPARPYAVRMALSAHFSG